MQLTRSLMGLAAFAVAVAVAAGEGAAAAPLNIPMDKVTPPDAAGSALPLGYKPAETPLPEGIARTSVDHRFARDGSQDYVGAAGLLCGLKPGDDSPGAAAAFGRDKDGKFVGAKLTISF